MTSQPDKSQRWRPRFSVRTLAIIVTLVCCYAACWGPTKRQGVDDVKAFGIGHFGDVKPVAPLIVGATDYSLQRRFFDGGPVRCHFLWFFGYISWLPYERALPPP